MLPLDDVLKSPVFGALIGAIITLFLVKLWEKKEAAKRDEKKRPQEHDERF